jgi:hypothetical protein
MSDPHGPCELEPNRRVPQRFAAEIEKVIGVDPAV